MKDKLIEYVKTHGIPVTVVVAALTVIGSIVASYFTASSTERVADLNNSTELYKIANATMIEAQERSLIRIANLESKVQELTEQVHLLTAENQKLKTAVQRQFNEIRTIGAYAENLPNPAWLKTIDSTMLMINEQYVRTFGISKWKYLNKKDHEVWDATAADGYVRKDKVVVECRCAIITFEEIPAKPFVNIGPGNETKLWLVIKWPAVRTNETEIFGIGGMAFDPALYNIPVDDLTDDKIIYGQRIDQSTTTIIDNIAGLIPYEKWQ